MPVFKTKARTAQAYLAGIGASGALMASAFVMFLILVGVVTFNAWPHVGNLLGGRAGNVALSSTAAGEQAPAAPPATLNLVQLLGGGPAATHPPRGHRIVPPHGIGGGIGGTAPGANGSQPGGPTGGGQTPVASPTGPAPQPKNVVQQTVSNVGNTVQSDTTSLGDALGGSSSPGLGGLVGGAGKTVNGLLQTLGGGGG